MDPLTTWLLNQGPAGVVAVALVYVFIKKEAQAERFQAEVKELHEQHRKDMDTLIERHLIRSEKWAEKGQQIADKALGRRRRNTQIEDVE